MLMHTHSRMRSRSRRTKHRPSGNSAVEAPSDVKLRSSLTLPCAEFGQHRLRIIECQQRKVARIGKSPKSRTSVGQGKKTRPDLQVHGSDACEHGHL
jgi:hypothetical protein